MNEFKDENETIGSTDSGPVYGNKDADDEAYKDFTKEDHLKAMDLHKKEIVGIDRTLGQDEMHTKLADSHRKASLKAKHNTAVVGESRRIKSFESFGVNEAKKEGPQIIGKAGKVKVAKALHALVDKYMKDVNEMSDLASIDFYVKDFAKWNDGSGTKPSKVRTK